MLLLLIYTFVSNIVFAVCDNGQITLHSFAKDDKNKAISSLGIIKPVISNITYIDKEENILRVPNMKKNYEELKNKRKTIKKSPKRTIQKIIKKNRSRRKLYLNQATSVPTKPPIMGDELDKFYAQEEMMQKNENLTANNQVNHKKKRKWNARVARYPMPFKQLQTKKDYKRHKRSDDRQDLFILTDLDEIEFMNNNNDSDNNIINAHVKNYW